LRRRLTNDLDVLLPAAGQEKLLGLGVAVEAEGLVFLEDALDGVADAVFVLAGLGFMA